MLWESSYPARGAELVGWGAHAEDISSVMRHHHFLPLCSSLSGRCSSPTAQQLNGFCVGSGRSVTRLASLRSSSTTALEARSASPCPRTAVFPLSQWDGPSGWLCGQLQSAAPRAAVPLLRSPSPGGEQAVIDASMRC